MRCDNKVYIYIFIFCWVYTYILHGQTGLAAVADAPPRVLAHVRTAHELVGGLEEYRIGILLRGHVQRDQMQLEVATGRREDQRHLRVVGAVAQATALEQYGRLGEMAFAHLHARFDVAKAVGATGIVVDLGQAFAAARADAFDDEAHAFVALALEAIGAPECGGAATAEQENVLGAAHRVDVALFHLAAGEATIAIGLVRFAGAEWLAVLQEVDELVAELEVQRAIWCICNSIYLRSDSHMKGRIYYR